MAINRLLGNVVVSDSQKSVLGDRHFFPIVILFGLLVYGCSESKLTQCEQIFRIVSQVNNSSQNVSYTENEDSSEMKNWLEAASIMNRAANNIKALHINDSELIKYQNQLGIIYRIYSQATYNAVEARESNSLEALELARIDAQKADQMQQSLVKDINAYCLNQ